MTARQCGASCVKGLFMVFNFVLWLSGLALLTVGVLAKTKFGRYMQLSTEIDYDVAPYILIGCGVFIVLVGFCGCWASMKEHGWALKIYMGILVILFLAECGGAIAGYVMRNKLHTGLLQGFKNSINNYKNTKDKTVSEKHLQTFLQKDLQKVLQKDLLNTSSVVIIALPDMTPNRTALAETSSAADEMIDELQGKLVKCCGATAYTDWFGKHGNTTKLVPASCCRGSAKECGCDKDGWCPTTDKSKIYTTGCVDSIVKLVKKNFLIIGGVALGIAVLQLLGVFCAFCLTKLIKENSQYENFA